MRIVTCAINANPVRVSQSRLAERRPQPGDQRIEPGAACSGAPAALLGPRFTRRVPGRGARDPLQRRFQPLRGLVRLIAVRAMNRDSVVVRRKLALKTRRTA